MRTVFRSFRIIDGDSDFIGSIAVENGIITDVASDLDADKNDYAVFNGFGRLILAPGFIDMHTHFRDPGFPEKEVLESASLAAVRGGWTTAVCMANTNPVIDNLHLAQKIRDRCSELELIDLYPVVSLTIKMEGKQLTDITKDNYIPLLLSEDGKDILSCDVFFNALKSAKNIPVSCHCDLDGEVSAIKRAIEIGAKAGCHLHIAHVSKKESAALIRSAKTKNSGAFKITAEAAPHHIALSSVDAENLGADTFGKVAPPLRSEEDRIAIINALKDGTIDVIATDHAPHTNADKENGSPGFTGLESAFSVVNTVLNKDFSMQQIISMLSSKPAEILGLKDRGKIKKGFRADITILDDQIKRKINSNFFSRSKNSPYTGKTYIGDIIMTMSNGKIVYECKG
jgi:dihydroorotase